MLSSRSSSLYTRFTPCAVGGVTASLVFVDILLRRQPRIAHDALRLASLITCRFTRHRLFTFIVAVDKMWLTKRSGVGKQVCQFRRRPVAAFFGGQNLARRIV